VKKIATLLREEKHFCIKISELAVNF